MRKVIAAMNMTLDGFCDHTVGIVDDEIHQHYSKLLKNTGTLVYGRKTYKLMESYWPLLVKKPSRNKANNEFAQTIDKVQKIVFSRKLKKVPWNNSKLATRNLKNEILYLKKQPGKPIAIGSPSLIAQLTVLGLIDEYQICVHPFIAGKGLVLFKNIKKMVSLEFVKSKQFKAGPILLYYKRKK